MKTSILLIDGDEGYLHANAEFLTACGYAVHPYPTLREAQHFLQEAHPALIILEHSLPDGSGIDFCEAIRLRRSIPMLFLSARRDPADIIEALGRGGDDYVTKPHDPLLLRARIEAILRRCRELPDTVHFGRLRFHIPMSLVYADDELLNLTQKEYGILLYLALNSRRIVSKQELYRAVWGQELHTDSSALWSAVSRMKRKLSHLSDIVSLTATHEGYELHLQE